MAQHLNERLVRGMPPPPAGNKILVRRRGKGFGLRVTAEGAKPLSCTIGT